MDFLNGITLITNYILIPGLTYGSQLALGALGITIIYTVLRFSNFYILSFCPKLDLSFLLIFLQDYF